MARKSLSDDHAKTIGQEAIFDLLSKLLSTANAKSFRQQPRDFSKNGPLSPEFLLSVSLYMVADARRRGYKHLLASFWDEAQSFCLPLPQEEPVSAASFCEARLKLKPELFSNLLTEVWRMQRESFDDSCRWHGRRVFAVDGSKINLNRSLNLGRHFHYPPGARNPQALVSALYDVGTKSPVAVQISPYDTSERAELLAVLEHLEERDVVVLDRGYPSHEVIEALRASKIDFLIRLPSRCSFKAVDTLRQGRRLDRRICLSPPGSANAMWMPLNLRWLKVKDGSGGVNCFVTSLPECKFSREDILELYHQRWDIEEFYKLTKSDYIGQGQFRSQTSTGIHQEILAQYLLLALTRYLALQARRAHDNSDLELDQKGAVLSVAAYLSRLFLQEDGALFSHTLHCLLKRMARHRYRRRKGRSFPRRSFKPARKWGPQGRLGA